MELNVALSTLCVAVSHECLVYGCLAFVYSSHIQINTTLDSVNFSGLLFHVVSLSEVPAPQIYIEWPALRVSKITAPNNSS